MIGAIGADALHLRDIEIRHADPAHLALLLAVGQRAPALFDIFLGLGPVDLIEVDDVHFEAAQAGFALAADGIRLQALVDLAVLVPVALALGEDVRAVGASLSARATTSSEWPSP